ncbi:MAG: YcxB family protein [Gemmatimonadota bacterium]
MTQPLTYEFRLDPDETIRAIRDVQRRQGFGWLHSAIWHWALWPVVVGMAVLYFFLPTDLRALWLVGIVAFLLAALAGLTPSVVRWQLRRDYRETPSLQGIQVYQFSDAGLTITGGATMVTLGWDAFVDAAETTEFFLFYYSKRQAYYLPKRAVGEDLERRRLRELIQLKLGDRATGFRPE